MSNVKVAVRVRPLSNREKEQGSQTIIEVIGDVIALTNLKVDPNNPYGDNREREKHFCYDFCYNSTSKPDTPGYGSQEQIFQDLGTDVIQSAVEGYNACLFAYGQTSTGKTYTMTGTEEEVGLIPRICEGLFSHIESEQDEKITFKVEISYLEIYNERVRDLLKSGFANEKYTLKVREHPKEGPYVQDLSSHRVKNLAETLGFLEKGNDNRTTAATHMHEHSSRSHAIVTLVFTQALFEDDLPREIVSKIHLVDLAGSERADTTSTLNYKGRLKEGANINKSLVTLGNVIKALAERSLLSWTQMGSTQSVTNSSAENGAHSPSSPRRHQTVFIPYRDSVLTWLLRDSLGGNSKTIMISTVTPASKYYNESLSTLRYAQRAKNIVNKPKINEDTNVALIRQLQEEIKRLKHELANAQMHGSMGDLFYLLPEGINLSNSDVDLQQAGLPVSVRDKGTVVEKLQEKENMAKQLTQSWRDKWNDPMQEGDDDVLCFHELRRASSHGIILDSQIPHLIGMDEDILSTGVIIYQLDVGRVLIGSDEADKPQDIVLRNPGIEKEHCYVENEDGCVIIHPSPGCVCKVNDIEISEPTQLQQGDVLLLGINTTFRFNNPAEAARLRERRKSSLRDDVDGLPNKDLLSVPKFYTTTTTPPFTMFNPNVELTSRYKTEPERIEQASQELEKTRLELREKEETLQLKEEQLFCQHEERKNEVERERHKLTEAIREFQKNKSKVEKLEKDTVQHIAEQQQQTRKIIEEAVKLNKEKSQDTSIQCDVIPKDTASIKTRKLSKEGRIKDLAQQELVNRVSTLEKSRSLALEAEALEEQEESIQVQQQKVRAREKDYKALDRSLIEELSHEKQVVGKLEAQEDQIQAYIQENKDLIKVAMDKPNPIRGGVSEMNLQSTGKKKHDALLPLQHINVERLRESSPKKELKVKKSPLSSQDDLHAGSSNENLQKKKKSPKNTKLTSSAEDITNRLYRQPKNVKVHKFLKKSSRHLLLNQPVRSTPKIRTPLTTPAPLILRRPPKPIINDPLKLRSFGGSDPNLARPGLVRSRSRIRQISSMCNLASVPEASYEAESEAESMHSEPCIPDAVAAVRRRNKHIDIPTERSRSMPTDGNFEQAWENYSQNMGLKIEPKYLNLSDSELNSPVKNTDDSCMINLNVGRRSKKRRCEIDSGPFAVETKDVDQDTLPVSIGDETPRNQDESIEETSDDDCQRAENSSMFRPDCGSLGREEYILLNEELNAEKGCREYPNFDITKQDQSSLHFENTESVMVFGSEGDEFICSDENSHSNVSSDSLDDMSEDSLSGCKDDEHILNPEALHRMDKSSESHSSNPCSPDIITRASPGEENYILIGNVSDDSMETKPQNVSAINIKRSVPFQDGQERSEETVPPLKRPDNSILIPGDSQFPQSGNSSQTSKSSQTFPTYPGVSSKSLPLKSPKDNLSSSAAISSVKPQKQHSGNPKEQSAKKKCTENVHKSGHLSNKKNSKSKLQNSASSEITLGTDKQRSQDKLKVIQEMVPQLELSSNVSHQRKQHLGAYSPEINSFDQETLRDKSKSQKGTAPDHSSADKTRTGTDDIRRKEKSELRRSPVPEDIEKSCRTGRKSQTKKPSHPESSENFTNKADVDSEKGSQKHFKHTTGEADTSDSSTELKPASTHKEKIRIKVKALPSDNCITGDTTTGSNSLPTTPVKVKFKSAKTRRVVLPEENISLSANSGNQKVDENELSRSSSSIISENEPISESEDGQEESSSGTTTKDSELDSVSESDAQKSEEVSPFGIQKGANDSVIVLVPGEKRTQTLNENNIEFKETLNHSSHTHVGLPTTNTSMTSFPQAESFKNKDKYSDIEFQEVSGNSVVMKLNQEHPLYWNETQTSLIDNTNTPSNKDKTNTDYSKSANILRASEYNLDNDDNLRKSDKLLHGEDIPLPTSLKDITYVQNTQSEHQYQRTSISEVNDQSTKSLAPGNPLQKPKQPIDVFEHETLSSPYDVNVLNEGDFQTSKVAALNPLKMGKTVIQSINTTVPLSWNQTQGQYVVNDNHEAIISLPNKSDSFKPDNQIQKQQSITEEYLSGSLNKSDHFNRTESNVQNISQGSQLTGAQSNDQYRGTNLSEVSNQSANNLVLNNPLQKLQQPTDVVESVILSSPCDGNALNDFQSSNTLQFMQNLNDAVNSNMQLCPPIQSMLASEGAAQNPLKTGKTDIQNINTTVPLSWNQTQGHYIVDDNQDEIFSSQNKSDKPSKLDNQIPNTGNSSKLDNQIQKQQPPRGENSSGSLNKSDHYNISGSNIHASIQHTKQTGIEDVATKSVELTRSEHQSNKADELPHGVSIRSISDDHHVDTRGREIQQNESENSEDSRGVEEADTDYSDDSLNGEHLEGSQKPNIENPTENINHRAGMENLNKPQTIAITSSPQYQNVLTEDSLKHQELQGLVVKVDSISSQLSNDSTADILQQNSKDQILSSNQSGSTRRQRKRAQRHQKDVKSDETDDFSDDSLASGSNSKPSSRPGSGKRRKRTRNSTEGANRKGDASTDEYAHSGNSSFSDDSLTFSEDRRGSHTIDLPQTNLSSAVEVAHINESLDQLNLALHNLPSSTDPMDDSMTQTEGGSIHMGMSPVSIWSSGDSGIQPLSGTEMSSCGIQTVISEENSIKSPKRRAWNLSISNPDVWKNNPLMPLAQTDEVIELTTSESPIIDEYSLEGQSTNNEIKFPSLTTASHSKLETVQPSAVEYDTDGKIKYLVTINEDETKILYNVEKTEYRTYSLSEENRARQGAQTIPDSIKINLTETKTVQKNDNYGTVQREKILYQGENASNSDAVVSSRLYLEARSFQFEQESSNGIVSREHSVDRQSVDSDHKSFIKSNVKHSMESLQPVTVLHETTIRDRPTYELDPQKLSNDLKESDSHMGISEEYDYNSTLQSTTIDRCVEGSNSTTDTTVSPTSFTTSFAKEKSNASENIMGNVAVDFIANGHRTLLLPVTSSYLQTEQGTNLANNNQDESNEETDKYVQTSGLMTENINKTSTTLQRKLDHCQLAIEIKSRPEESVFKDAHGIDNKQIAVIDEEFYSSPSFEYESNISKSIDVAGTNTAEGHLSENENEGKSKYFRQRDYETSSVNSSPAKELTSSEVTTQDRQEVTAISINRDSEDHDETDFDDGYSSINTSGQRSGSIIYHPDIGQFLVASADTMAEDSWTITYPQESKHSNEQSNMIKTQKSTTDQENKRDSSDNNIISQPLNILPEMKDAVTIQSGHAPSNKNLHVHSVSYVEEHTDNTVEGLQQRKYHDQDVIASKTDEWNKDSFTNKTDVEKTPSKDLNVQSESYVEANTDNTVEGCQETKYHVEMTHSVQDGLFLEVDRSTTDKYLISQQSSSSASGNGDYHENVEVEGAYNLVTGGKLQYKLELKSFDTNIDQSSERASVMLYHDQPDILSECYAPNIDGNQKIDDNHTIQTDQLPSKNQIQSSKQAKIVYGNEQIVEEASFVGETMEEYMRTVNSTESRIPSDVHAQEYTSHIHVEPVNTDINVESTNFEPYMQITRSTTNTDSKYPDVDVENSFIIKKRNLIQSERKPILVFDSTTDITQNQRKKSRTYLSSTEVLHPSLAVNKEVDEEETISGHSIKTTHYTFINPEKRTSSFVSSVDGEEVNKSKNETDILNIVSGSTELHSPLEALKITQTFLNSGSVLSKSNETSSVVTQHNSSDLFSKLPTSHISKAYTYSYQKDVLESNANLPVNTATSLILNQDENHFSATQRVLAVGQAFLNTDKQNKIETNQTDILVNEMQHESQFPYTHKPVLENQKIIEFFPPVVNKVPEVEVKCVESTFSSVFPKDSILFELDPKNLQSGRNHHTESDQSGTELEDSGFHTLTTTDSSLSPDSEEHRSPRRTPSYRLPFDEESNSRNSTVTTIHESKEEKVNFTHPEEPSLNFSSDEFSEYSYKTKENQLVLNNQISTTVKSVPEYDDTKLLYKESKESQRETDVNSTQEYKSHQYGYVDSVSTTFHKKQHSQLSENTYSKSLRNSESNDLHSSDEIYLTPEEHNRSGSSSSSFKTPQESPRQNHYSHIAVSNTEFKGPTYSESLPITSSKFRSSNDKDLSENVDNLKWELARRIAKLQSRVRSLSDSAISSDFTDQEASINLRSSFNRQSPRSSGCGSGLMNTQSIEQSLQEISTYFVNMPPHSSSLLQRGFCSDIPNKLANVVIGDHSLTSSPSTNNLASLLNTHSFSRLHGRKWRSFGELSELSGEEMLRLFKEDFEASQNRISLSHHDKNIPIPITDLDADSDVEENLCQFTEEERYISWTDVQYSITEDFSLDNADSSSKREQINKPQITIQLNESNENRDFYLGNIANIQNESGDVSHTKRRSIDRGVNCLPEDLFDESKRYLRQKSPSMSELENGEPIVKDFEKAHSTGCVDMLDSPVNSSASSNDSITFVFVGNSEEKTDRTHSNPNVSRPSSNTSSGRKGMSEGQLALICPNKKEKVLFPKCMQNDDLFIGNRAVSTNNLSEHLSEKLRRSYSTSLLDVVTVEEPDIDPFPPSGNGEDSIDGRTSEIVTVKSNNMQANQAVTKKQILRTFSSQFGPSCVSSTDHVHSETTGTVPKHTTCYIKSTGMETKRDDNVSISDIKQQTILSNQKAPKVTLVNSVTQIDDHHSENISSHICREWQSYQDDIFSVDLSDESGFLTDLNSVPSSARDTPQSSIRHFSGNTQEDMFTAFGSLRVTATTLVSSYTQTDKESRDSGQGLTLNHSNSETQTTPPLSPELRIRHSLRTTEVQTERNHLDQNTQESPSNTMILAEIVDLKKEHNKMMELLGRSRDRPSRLEILNSLKSPTSDSSGSISPITVIDKLSSSTRGLSPSHTTTLSSNLIDDESQTETRLNDSIDRLQSDVTSHALLDSSRNDNSSQRSFNSYSESVSTRNQRDEIGHLDYSDTIEDQSGSSSSRSQGRNSNDSLVYVPIGTGNRRYFVTTAIEAADSIENLEDFSQTKVKYNAAKSQSGDKTADTGCLQDHLDMLQQERVEIIDLLNLNYLPASLTVELLEAKLNHCIGQTDALLQSLEDTWNDEEILSRPVPPVQKITEISKEYINKYRSELRQSKRDYTVFKEEMERKASKGRGRRKSRTSDLIRMTRKSQIDAFKLERMREQQMYERTRSASPLITPPASPARTTSTFEPSYLTPKQRIGHLVSLRKNIVESSEDEMSELRHGSYSPHYSDRSYSPDYYATYSPSRRSSSLGYSQSHHSPLPPFSMYSPDVSLTLNLSNSPPPGLRTSSRDRSSVSNRSEHGNRSQDTSAYISLPYHQYMTEGLDPSRLLQESADVRNRNLLEISRAHNSLQQTKSHYTTSPPLRTTSPSVKHSRAVREYSPVTPNHGISKDDIDKDIENLKHIQKTTAFGNSCLERSISPSTSDISSISTPSYAAYAKDVLARSERSITNTTRSNKFPVNYTERDSSPSSIYSADLDSLPEATSTPRDNMRPINSQDIRTRIARRKMTEKKKRSSDRK
ncbi:hypothetical protein SNE40_009889 [Patella caerulea]|uniref:Kinesin motor domain-containing protein n=1 Tax=Patella caerulea TaxID=87958 RepID=A0AAN8JS96_PATCE